MKKEVLLPLLVLSLFLLIVSSCASAPLKETRPAAEATSPATPIIKEDNHFVNTEAVPKLPAKGLTFEVDIPENTLPGDLIKIYVFQKPYRMEKIGPYRYQLFLNETQLFPWENALPPRPDYTVKYRYSRNGWDFYTAEYLEPTAEEPNRDTNDYFWTKHGREITYEPGKVQRDMIGRWRFFPLRGLPERTTPLEPKGTFQPRINNERFWSGQTIEDLYVAGFHDFFNSTAQHMKKIGYTWVEFDPPWQWTEEKVGEKSWPKVVNDIGNAPNYPDDETFLEEVRAYKAAGLKILIAPQLCCTTLNSKDKSKEWWGAYFAETERFLVHFARLAEEAHADAFMYAVPSWEMGNVPTTIDINAEWREIFRKIHTVFSGEVGEMIWMLGPDAAPTPQPIPDTNFVQWADQLDFFLVATEFPLSMSDNPTDEELKKGAAAVLDGAKVFYDQFHKPLIFRNGYFNVKYSWKGQTFYQINSIPGPSDPEAKLKESIYEFNSEDQARTVNAYFQAIAERPWIIGYFHFGYSHWEDPLSPWLSIRGKPAEDVWRKWNEVRYDS